MKSRADTNDVYAVIAISFPFTNLITAYEIKKLYPHMKMLFIEFDLYTYNPAFLDYDKRYTDRFSKRLREEMAWCEQADRIFVQKEMYGRLAGSELKPWINRFQPTELPNLVSFDDAGCQNILSKDYVNAVYAGMFYEDIRSPAFLLKLFAGICKLHAKVKLHILGFGCEDQLESAKKIMGENLVLHGKRDKQYTRNAIFSADVLINVSNSTATQVPSKIIEYIGSGKPIVNLYSIDDDACGRILSEYPLRLSVRADEAKLSETAEAVYDFISANRGRAIPFEDIKKKYKSHLPEVFADEVIKALQLVGKSEHTQ